jgi:hypothetical protein
VFNQHIHVDSLASFESELSSPSLLSIVERGGYITTSTTHSRVPLQCRGGGASLTDIVVTFDIALPRLALMMTKFAVLDCLEVLEVLDDKKTGISNVTTANHIADQ